TYCPVLAVAMIYRSRIFMLVDGSGTSLVRLRSPLCPRTIPGSGPTAGSKVWTENVPPLICSRYPASLVAVDSRAGEAVVGIRIVFVGEPLVASPIVSAGATDANWSKIPMTRRKEYFIVLNG